MPKERIKTIMESIIAIGLTLPDENDEDIDIIVKALKRIYTRLANS